jgi:hypothetical protein
MPSGRGSTQGKIAEQIARIEVFSCRDCRASRHSTLTKIRHTDHIWSGRHLSETCFRADQNGPRLARPAVALWRAGCLTSSEVGARGGNDPKEG